MTQNLSIRAPDDWHVHLRDGDILRAVAPFTARQFARAIIMPNLAPPVTCVANAQAYHARVMACIPEGMSFTPLMTCYLTDRSDPNDLVTGYERGVYTAAKLYPAHATTNAAAGVSDVNNISAALERMQAIGMPLLVHGEVTDRDVDIFDREAVFIERVLAPLMQHFPALKIVLEHITTRQAVEFVESAPATLAATITPHHLWINRNALFQGGLRPHAYCLPVAKREVHRLALCRAATSGSPKFFAGTDTAPHLVGAKESACGCAGIFNAPYAVESYAALFHQLGALDRLEAFLSVRGAQFYGLPLNTGQIMLEHAGQAVPDRIETAAGSFIPFHAGETLPWRMVQAQSSD